MLGLPLAASAHSYFQNGSSLTEEAPREGTNILAVVFMADRAYIPA